MLPAATVNHLYKFNQNALLHYPNPRHEFWNTSPKWDPDEKFSCSPHTWNLEKLQTKAAQQWRKIASLKPTNQAILKSDFRLRHNHGGKGLHPLLCLPQHDELEPNLKKTSTETEYGVWKLLSYSFIYQSPKNPFRSPCEKNHKTSRSKVKSLNRQKFFNNKWKFFVK